MRRFFDVLRIVFISIEFAFLCGIAVLAVRMPQAFVFVGSVLKSDSDLKKWIPVIPIALCVYAFQLAWKLITPLTGSNRELLDWPDYWKLKFRIKYSLVLSFLTAMIATSIWVFSAFLDNYWVGIFAISSFAVGLVNVGCMIFATFSIREILEP